MENSDKNTLMKEYAEQFGKIIYRPIKLAGFYRFEIINNQIVQLSYNTMVYNIIVLLIADLAVGYLLYSSIVLGNYLQIPDALCVCHFAIYANIMLINITFLNRKSGLDLVTHCIEFESYIGVKETAFIRNVAIGTFLVCNYFTLAANICTGAFLYHVYKVSMDIHIVGSAYFFWIFFSYNDYFLVGTLFMQNCIRIRYLNVALMKIGGMNEQYVPSRSLFNLLFWNKKNNNLVTFHKKSGVEEFNRAYRMCFDMIAVLENCCSFPILVGVWTVAVGTFVAVQTFIMRVKNPTAMDNERLYMIGGWLIINWGILLLMAFVVDMSPHQIQQTKLICSYIQLKPYKSAEIYKLTKTVLGTINMRAAVPNIYNLFYFDSGFLLRTVASTLVYITVQLQLAFPTLPINNVHQNGTV